VLRRVEVPNRKEGGRNASGRLNTAHEKACCKKLATDEYDVLLKGEKESKREAREIVRCEKPSQGRSGEAGNGASGVR